MDNLIQRGDLNQRLTKALEIKGQKSPILTLDNSVVAVVIAEDLTKQTSYTQPSSRKLAVSVNLAAVLAEFGMLMINNPAGSGVIGVLELVTATTSVNMPISFGLSGFFPGTAAGLFFRDLRNAGVPSIRAWQGSNPANTITGQYMGFQVSNAIATPWYELEGMVIRPGDTFGIVGGTVNVAFSPTIWLEEIPIA